MKFLFLMSVFLALNEDEIKCAPTCNPEVSSLRTEMNKFFKSLRRFKLYV